MWKLFILNFIILLFTSCNGQTNKTKTSIKKNIMVEKLDIKQLEREGEKTPITNTDYSYELIKRFKDGSSFEISGSVNENGFVKREIPALPSFETVYKEYYKNGILKKKEIYIGENVKIKKSMYYDDEGHLIKEIDEDKKFGKIKYEFILKFLQSKKYINLNDGSGRYDDDARPAFSLKYDYNKNIWYVTIVRGKQNTKPPQKNDIGEPTSYFPLMYTIDGDSGKIIKEIFIEE